MIPLADLLAFVAGAVVIWLIKKYFLSQKQQPNLAPLVPGIPLLGCALEYKKDPVGFLLNQRKKFGGVFRMNLAGFEMTVVSDGNALHQVHNAREDILSSYEAVRQCGFTETLGYNSVYFGSVLHRDVAKNDLQQNMAKYVQRLTQQIKQSTLFYCKEQKGTVDMLETARKIFLQTIISIFIDKEVLQNHPSFTDEYYKYEESLEDVTMLSTSLPPAISIFFQRSVANKRKVLMGKLLPVIERLLKENPSCYASKLAEMSKRHEDFPGITPELVAEYCIGNYLVLEAHSEGILFAGHKNPSIACSQTLLMLLEHPEHFNKVKEECKRIVPSGSSLDAVIESPTFFDKLNELQHLDACAKEVLRLTCHAIGAVRYVQEDFTLRSETGTYVVPKGSTIGASHILMALDEKRWPDPHTFNPNRWNTEQAKQNPLAQPQGTDLPNSFIPFSGGTHVCPGRFLALHIIKAFIVTWVSLFDLEVQKPIPGISFHRATLAQRAAPVMVHYQAK